jgi:hypothetical protein
MSLYIVDMYDSRVDLHERAFLCNVYLIYVCMHRNREPEQDIPACLQGIVDEGT